MVHAGAVGVVQVAARVFEVSELRAGAVLGFRWGRASVDELLDFHVEVEPELVVDFAPYARGGDPRESEGRSDIADAFHWDCEAERRCRITPFRGL